MNQMHFNRAVCETVHTVSAGETLYSIAKRYDTDLQRLMELNGITEPWGLAVGQEICIPKKLSNTDRGYSNFMESNVPYNGNAASTEDASSGCRQSPAADSASNSTGASVSSGTTHTVQSGETLYGISRKYGISLSMLLESNPSMDPYRLQVGTVLQIPVPVPQQQQYRMQQQPQPTVPEQYRTTAEQAPAWQPTPYTPQPAPAPTTMQLPNTAITSPINRETANTEKKQPESNPTVSDNNTIFHTVSSDDTLTSLLTGYGICMHALMHENPGIDFSGALSEMAGTQVCIPNADLFRRCQDNQPYLIQSGDTLYTISDDSGISTDELLRMNPCCNAMDFSVIGTRIRR